MSGFMTFDGGGSVYVGAGLGGNFGGFGGFHGSGFGLGVGGAFGLGFVRTLDLLFLFGLLQNGFMAHTPFKHGGAPAINEPAPQA